MDITLTTELMKLIAVLTALKLIIEGAKFKNEWVDNVILLWIGFVLAATLKLNTALFDIFFNGAVGVAIAVWGKNYLNLTTSKFGITKEGDKNEK